MIPGTLSAPVYRGAKWEHTLTLKQRGSGTPVDLSGLGPFAFEVEDSRTRATLASATVTSAYDETGVVNIMIPAATTKRFPLGDGTIKVGMRDALNNPYIQATLDVKHFTPDPA